MDNYCSAMWKPSLDSIGPSPKSFLFAVSKSLYIGSGVRRVRSETSTILGLLKSSALWIKETELRGLHSRNFLALLDTVRVYGAHDSSCGLPRASAGERSMDLIWNPVCFVMTCGS